MPGDAVAAAERALLSDDPALLDQLLSLPQAHLIVDGYNVTKTGFPDLSLEKQRTRLLTGLSNLAARSGAEVTCCFDGAALEGRVPAAAARGVRVLFSKAGETADELIRRLVRAEPRGPAGVRGVQRPRGRRRRTPGRRPPGLRGRPGPPPRPRLTRRSGCRDRVRVPCPGVRSP